MNALNEYIQRLRDNIKQAERFKQKNQQEYNKPNVSNARKQVLKRKIASRQSAIDNIKKLLNKALLKSPKINTDKYFRIGNNLNIPRNRMPTLYRKNNKGNWVLRTQTNIVKSLINNVDYTDSLFFNNMNPKNAWFSLGYSGNFFTTKNKWKNKLRTQIPHHAGQNVVYSNYMSQPLNNKSIVRIGSIKTLMNDVKAARN